MAGWLAWAIGCAICSAPDGLARRATDWNSVKVTRGDTAAAEAYYQEAIAIARDLAVPGPTTVMLCNYARLLIGSGAGERAPEHLRDCFSIAGRNVLPGMNQHLLETSAGLAAVRGDAAMAARLNGAALARGGESGARREPVDEAFIAPLLAIARDDIGNAAFDAAENAGRLLRPEAAMAELDAWLNRPEAS